jgi:hypothetical protein
MRHIPSRERGTMVAVAKRCWRRSGEVELDSWVLLYPSITQSPRLRGRLDIALTFRLTGRLGLQLSESGTYDSDQPLQGAGTTDYRVLTSISYNFGPSWRDGQPCRVVEASPEAVASPPRLGPLKIQNLIML